LKVTSPENSPTMLWSGDTQFQFDEKIPSSISSDEKLDDLCFSESPSSPSSDEFVDMPLVLPILDSSDLLNPSDAFLLPSIFTEPILDSPESFQNSISLPYPMGNKRHHDTLAPTPGDPLKKPNSRKGKKLKTDGNTKRERNKVSAAKYRQRRKVYIDGLEDHVRQLNEKLEAQSKAIASLKTENQMLKDQLSYLKKLVDSFRCKTPMQSVNPINQFIKAESSFGKAMKPMGAGLFMLAICCLVFSFHSFNDAGAPMSAVPVRSASRTLLHHEDSVIHHDDESNANDSIAAFASLPLNSKPHPPEGFSPPIDKAADTLIDVDMSLEPTLEMMETIVSRHSLQGSAAAA